MNNEIKRRGRPRREVPTVAVNVRIEPDLALALHKFATEHGKSKAVVVQEALRKMMA